MLNMTNVFTGDHVHTQPLRKVTSSGKHTPLAAGNGL